MTEAPTTTGARRQVIKLPVPVSTNHLFANRKDGKGRYKTASYRQWIAQADRHLLTQKRALAKVIGPVSVTIRVPRTTRIDVDNFCKATCDYLVSRELTDDDHNYTRVTVERAALPAGECEVVVEADMKETAR